MINWKVRFKNPVWWAQMVLAIFTPILAYAGLTAQDLTIVPGDDLERQAYAVNDRIADPEIRNLHILAAV